MSLLSSVLSSSTNQSAFKALDESHNDSLQLRIEKYRRSILENQNPSAFGRATLEDIKSIDSGSLQGEKRDTQLSAEKPQDPFSILRQTLELYFQRKTPIDFQEVEAPEPSLASEELMDPIVTVDPTVIDKRASSATISSLTAIGLVKEILDKYSSSPIPDSKELFRPISSSLDSSSPFDDSLSVVQVPDQIEKLAELAEIAEPISVPISEPVEEDKEKSIVDGLIQLISNNNFKGARELLKDHEFSRVTLYRAYMRLSEPFRSEASKILKLIKE